MYVRNYHWNGSENIYEAWINLVYQKINEMVKKMFMEVKRTIFVSYTYEKVQNLFMRLFWIGNICQ